DKLSIRLRTMETARVEPGPTVTRRRSSPSQLSSILCRTARPNSCNRGADLILPDSRIPFSPGTSRCAAKLRTDHENPLSLQTPRRFYAHRADGRDGDHD